MKPQCFSVPGLSQNDVIQILRFKNASLLSRWEHGEIFPGLVNSLRLSGIAPSALPDMFPDLSEAIRGEFRRSSATYTNCGTMEKNKEGNLPRRR